MRYWVFVHMLVFVIGFAVCMYVGSTHDLAIGFAVGYLLSGILASIAYKGE